jgi:hypothetical protein
MYDLRSAEYIVELETALVDILRSYENQEDLSIYSNTGKYYARQELDIERAREIYKKFQHLLINGPSKIHYESDDIKRNI